MENYITKYQNEDDLQFAIQNWTLNRNKIEFLCALEELRNANLNRVQFEAVKKESDKGKKSQH